MSDYANLKEQLYLALQYIEELEAQLPGAQTRHAELPPAVEPAEQE
jgi:hypothetical protein